MTEQTSSISLWLDQLRAGDPAAAQPIWERYHEQLVRLVRARLPDRVRPVADEEDVVQSAFRSFFRAAEQGRFPSLADAADLWAVLVTIADRKRLALFDRETALKRGGLAQREAIPEGMAAPELTPQFAAQVAEEYERLLTLLRQRDPLLEKIALWKFEGYSDAEIAALSGRSLATVQRKLKLIREIWTAHAAE